MSAASSSSGDYVRGAGPGFSSGGSVGSTNSSTHIPNNNHGALAGLDATFTSFEGMTLTAKPHAFAGAVLSPKHARELTPSLCLAIASALAEQSYRKMAVPYTLWITEAWRVLGWAEPSAALFWEMATMYHTLYLAGRAYATDFPDHGYPNSTNIPPILSCGSTSSMGSGNTHHTDRMGSVTGGTTIMDKKKYSTSASAKELPIWLVSTFLVMHCEEMAYQRNLSGLDDRRFYRGGGGSPSLDPFMKKGGKVDFSSLLKYPGLSPRTRLHAGWNNDNSHCTAYLLRHLRKLLLLAAIPHNPDAVRACMHLAAIPSPPPPPVTERAYRHRTPYTRYSADDLRRQHDDEHGNVGLQVRLNMEDLERLHFWLQPAAGGSVDDPPLKIGDFLWSNLYSAPVPPMATIPIGDVEREVRRHLELELLMSGMEMDDKEDMSSDGEEAAMSSALSQLSLTDSHSDDDGERAKQPQQSYQKELTYMHLRGTTILLKPNNHDVAPGGASVASGDPPTSPSNSRLHDLAISDCSDVHMYLLQPFENVTIAACTGCTIVIGAVAGLLHVVDCEKTKITAAARRILVSNSCDAVLSVFTPTPPLLVGDNRSCQFAPYNTYYEGLREDLLATGLAAAAIGAVDNQSPFHGSRSVEGDAAWPPVQCASNKWKQPIEISKLEIPQVAAATQGGEPGADDKALGGMAGSVGDSTVQAPVLLPASEFHVLFVPLESESTRQRKLEPELQDPSTVDPHATESKYCRVLAEVLQYSPFRLPIEYERRALVKADRMRSIQQAVRKNLTDEEQLQFQEELNRGFRDWLVTSGNLRQVLDLVHLERRGGI
ncbi:tubulin binding cofactor C [Nitzschia inconspicua]|uniref:TBCC domain-containing protein 1 n=1 Tax=Nitzschia inconspicua TaxID=303405 RepID=A0A9K3PAM0_9STRA|nr:tubulin binding cofactor C [Nitzschia inconspicua]